MEAETSDEVLIARLRELGYTLGIPSIDVDNEPVGTASKDDEEAAEDAKFARYRENAPTFLDRLLAAKEAEARAVETEGDATETAVTSSDESATADALQSLLAVIDEHRESVQAAMAEARRKKGRENDRSGTSSSRATSLSPIKRLRQSSPSSSSSSEESASSPRPSTPGPPAGSRRPRNRHLSDNSPTPIKRPPSSVKLAGLATLALFSTDAQAAAPSSPFVGAAHSLDEVVSNADFATVVHLAQDLQRNKALFDLAQSQASATGRQTGSNLNFLGKHLFSGSPVSPTNPARAALRLARLINLDAGPDKTSSPTNRSALPVLTTPHTTCIQCNSALHLREHPDEPVWLVRPAQGAEQCLVAIYICSNRPCRARHAPDHVEVSHQDRSVWLWDNEATAFKIGQRTWTTSDGAAHLRHLLLQQAVTPGGFAQLWNRQYSDLAPEDDWSSAVRDLPDSHSDDLEEDEERPRRFGAGPSPSRKGKRSRDSPFRLRAAHVWRAIVISSCLRAAAQNSKYGRLASPVRPSTLDLVELANSCLFDEVLPPHQCTTCTRPRQVWLGGSATDAERRAGIRWAGTQASESDAFEEDVKLIGGPPVQMAVCDGITIGYFLCAAPGCPNSPKKHRRASRFCDDHYNLHELCGVVDCGRTRSGVQGGGGLSEACDDPAHEERWLKFVWLRDENRDRGWRGRANEPRRRPGNVAPPLTNDDLLSDSEDDDSSETDDDDGEASGGGGRKRFSHMWAMRKSSHLQLLVASCGTPLAWRSFTSGETVREVFDFLASVYERYTSDDKNPIPFPSYVAYDRACQVLRHAAAVAEVGQELPPFLKSSRLVVDGFHRQCHSRDDLLCSTLCNPAPLDGSAPDLVIPLKVAAAAKQSKKGSRSRRRTTQERETGRVFQRAFNTSAAEQLNSQLSRFAFVLGGMKAPNFSFLVHVLLRYRSEEM